MCISMLSRSRCDWLIRRPERPDSRANRACLGFCLGFRNESASDVPNTRARSRASPRVEGGLDRRIWPSSWSAEGCILLLSAGRVVGALLVLLCFQTVDTILDLIPLAA